MKGIYLHIPFCEKKCTYCDFYSIENRQQQTRFVEAISQEIQFKKSAISADCNSTNDNQFSTIFFGGGTPSLLTPHELEQILSTLYRTYSIAPDAEITMECNPGTVTVEKLSDYKSLGVNRLSFGIQSFYEEDLRFLSRIHDKNQATQAVDYARKAGFNNVNIDLMFALPHQQINQWESNLLQAIELQTEHISAYSLIFEDGTPLNAQRLRGEVSPQNEENDAAMYRLAMEILTSHGYQQYEVSNYAKDSLFCRHNMLYWQGNEYISFGPSAHGYWNDERYWNVRSLTKYLDEIHHGRLPVVNSERLEVTEKLFERIFLGLRANGIDIQRFRADFKLQIDKLATELFPEFFSAGFLRTSNNFLHLTHEGYLVCDELTNRFIARIEEHLGKQWSKEQGS